jgi:hypothetical protein
MYATKKLFGFKFVLNKFQTQFAKKKSIKNSKVVIIFQKALYFN